MAGPGDLSQAGTDVQSMIRQGATRDEVSAYLASQNVSAEALANSLNGAAAPGGGGALDQLTSGLGKVANAVGGATGAAIDAARGQHDPKFAGVDSFSMKGLTDPEIMSSINRGRLVTYNDEDYGHVIKSTLGKRVLKAEKDAHGYEVLTYTGDDGALHRAYVNKPGLDTDDIGRGIAEALPYVAAGGAVGGAVKGAATVVRMGAQALTGAATSLAADSAAQNMGSKGSHDLGRAGFAAAGGALFEGLAPAAAAVWRRFISQPGYVKDGVLTEAGQRMAKSMGLDPTDMEQRLAKALATDVSVGADPAEVAAKQRLNEFGIVTSKGQRTKDSGQLGTEEEMRRGLMGDQAKTMMKGLDKEQSESIESAVFDKVGGALAPKAPGREPATLGQDIKGGLQRVKGNLDEAEHQLWGEAGPMFPQPEGMALLGPRVVDSLNSRHIWPKPNLGAFPMTNDMLQILDDYVAGKVPEQVLPLIGKGKSNVFIDDMRRYLLNLYKSAERGSADEKSAGGIYHGFNDWIDDLANAALLVGKPEAAASLKAARGFTKEVHDLFEPGGATTPAAKKLATVMSDVTSPEEAVRAIVGTPTGNIAPGQVQMLASLKRALLEHGEKDTWDSVRLAYWAKIVQDRTGETLTPQRLQTNIDAAFHNQRSVLNVLYNHDEMSLMGRLSKTLDDAIAPPQNASGTSYELKRMMQSQSGDGVMKTFLQTQSKRELFSKHNVLMSRIYGALAKKVPISIFGSKEGAGAKLAERAMSQDVTRVPAPSLGGFGAAIGAEAE